MSLRIPIFSLGALVSLAFSGCTVVQVTGPSQTSVSYHAGAVRILSGDENGTLVVKTLGVGVAAQAPCKVLLVIRNQADLQQAKELLETISVARKSTCTADL